MSLSHAMQIQDFSPKIVLRNEKAILTLYVCHVLYLFLSWPKPLHHRYKPRDSEKARHDEERPHQVLQEERRDPRVSLAHFARALAARKHLHLHPSQGQLLQVGYKAGLFDPMSHIVVNVA